jgi:hypothetical protein
MLRHACFVRGEDTHTADADEQLQVGHIHSATADVAAAAAAGAAAAGVASVTHDV